MDHWNIFNVLRRYRMRVFRPLKFILRETQSFHVRLLFWVFAIELQEQNRTNEVPVFFLKFDLKSFGNGTIAENSTEKIL